MNRALKIASLVALALVIVGLPLLGLCVAQDPAPQDPAKFVGPVLPDTPPVAKAPTVGDVVAALNSAKADQVVAQTARDAAAKALADADAALTDKSTITSSADASVKSAVSKTGPVIVDGVVYEPAADGYRSFRPASADTPIPPDPDPK
jgi:hypothetical protein